MMQRRNGARRQAGQVHSEIAQAEEVAKRTLEPAADARGEGFRIIGDLGARRRFASKQRQRDRSWRASVDCSPNWRGLRLTSILTQSINIKTVMKWLTAEQALKFLGVRSQTLYANVSRGTDPGKARSRRPAPQSLQRQRRCPLGRAAARSALGRDGGVASDRLGRSGPRRPGSPPSRTDGSGTAVGMPWRLPKAPPSKRLPRSFGRPRPCARMPIQQGRNPRTPERRLACFCRSYRNGRRSIRRRVDVRRRF